MVPMKKSRFTEEQIVFALTQVCLQHGFGAFAF
jgi:hypothetical protein